MSSPHRVRVIVPVSSFRVASATLEGPREVVTSRGSEISVMVASIVALALARREEIPAMAGGASPDMVKLLAPPPGGSPDGPNEGLARPPVQATEVPCGQGRVGHRPHEPRGHYCRHGAVDLRPILDW